MWARLRTFRWPSPASAWVVRLALVAGFLCLSGRFWHPFHGFSYFLQLDRSTAAVMLPALRDGPLYVHPEEGSYDGGYYMQVATNPALDDPALVTALDDAGYRARRILLGAVAWCAGSGEPVRVALAYAGLNLLLWFTLAALLWRVFPVADGRATLAWALLLAGAGVLFSVRLALTDLATLTLTAAALVALEHGRRTRAAGLIGLAGLTRETGVLAAVSLWEDRIPWRARAALARLAGRLALTVLPLGLWLLYVHQRLGSSAGLNNLAWPLAGWSARWVEFVRDSASPGNPALLAESVLEHVALTVQAVYLVWRREPRCPWWRTGAAYLVLLLAMGHAVWGGFPNAASRVLLPLTLAFNVRVVRNRGSWLWLLAGNLSVVAGVHSLWTVPGAPHQLSALNAWSSRSLLETDERWSVAEWNGKWRWAWCDEAGGLVYRQWPHVPRVRLQLQLRGVTPRELEVWRRGARVWAGRIGDRPEWITLPELPLERGRLELELRCPAPPAAEGVANTARKISFACFGARPAE